MEEGMKMETINDCYRRNRRKETRPEVCPKASESPLIAEHVGRNLGGSHSTFLPFMFIHRPCSMKIAGFLWVELEARFSCPEWTSRVPKLVIRYEPSWEKSSLSMNPLMFKVFWRAPVAVSQSRTVLSLEPDASSRPSGEKATDRTQCEWPWRVCCRLSAAVSNPRVKVLSLLDPFFYGLFNEDLLSKPRVRNEDGGVELFYSSVLSGEGNL
jgi:hypothetical protein